MQTRVRLDEVVLGEDGAGAVKFAGARGLDRGVTEGDGSARVRRMLRTEAEYTAIWTRFYEKALAEGADRNIARYSATQHVLRCRSADEGRGPLGSFESYF